MKKTLQSPWFAVTIIIACLMVGYGLILAKDGKLTASECTLEHERSGDIAEQ